MEKIEICYTDLRKTAESVMSFVKTEYWDEENTLRTKIEEDLGITGIDAAELMDKFAQTYKVDLSEFDFSKHFSPEGFSGNPIVIVFAAILLIGFIIKMVVALAIYPFDPTLNKKIQHYSLSDGMSNVFRKIWPDEERLQDVTIQDLVTSAVTGKFTKRETVKFELIK